MAYLVKQSHSALAVTSSVPVDESLPRACVIGAGSSGIAAARSLHLAGSAEHRRDTRRFYLSPRHTMEVDFDHYLWDLERERKKGHARASS